MNTINLSNHANFKGMLQIPCHARNYRRTPTQKRTSTQCFERDIPTAQLTAMERDTYIVTHDAKLAFARDGFVMLPGVMTEEEMKREVDEVYYKFLRGEVPVPGLDLCDMSGAQGHEPSEYTIYNIMLPRLYYPSWQGNLLERRCLLIAQQLLEDDTVQLDFDQILAKRPHSKDSVMAWHQDKAYWPHLTSDTATANCWLAVTDVSLESGCMRYIPGSHKEPQLRRHVPVAGSREESHAIHTILDTTKERVVHVPMTRGSVLVHNERVVHGSGPNMSANWRCAYVLNFKKKQCIQEERAMGFTHSHNDSVNWDKFLKT